jgi:hypothetical protein
MIEPRSAVLVLAAVLASACQSASASVPAVLMHADEGTMHRLKSTLAKAVGRAQVELGPGDPTQSSVLSVLPVPPGPLEDRSLAKPLLFRLEIVGATCSLVREESGARITLEGVDCRAVAP